MAKGKKPKFHVGQVVCRTDTGNYAVIVGRQEGESIQAKLGDVTWWMPMYAIRPLNKREIGPTRKLKGER